MTDEKKGRQPPHQIEVRVREMNQLFNSMDPSPFHEKELDADAEEYIVSWAQELPAGEPFDLVVYLDRYPERGDGDVAAVIADAIHHFFAYKADLTGRQLGQLTRQGWKDLLIGVVFLGACIFIANMLGQFEDPFVSILKESLVIGGWVAMWRPMEVFLYERWPVRDMCRLYDKLGGMKVEVRLKNEPTLLHSRSPAP